MQYYLRSLSMKNKTPLIIKELKSHYNLGSDTDFANFLGIAPTTLSSWKSRNSMDYDLVYSKCVGINANWLLTGEGPMMLSDTPVAKRDTSGDIPLVELYAVGGFGNSSFKIEEQDVKDYYVIPKFKHRKIDFMIEVHGSSMYPKYNSGDVVACTIIKESQFIQWNKVHVIATKEQGILIKRLKSATDENSLLAISDNKDYDPFELPKKEITGLALVVGVIRLE